MPKKYAKRPFSMPRRAEGIQHGHRTGEISRRHFLGASLAAGSSLFLPTLRAAPRRRDGTVIVIGAGMAGVTAARVLHESGFDVTVLEGRDRLGGRIWTRNDLGLPLDHGAAWIFGYSKVNPIGRIADRLGLEVAVTDFQNNSRYDHDGSLFSAAEVDECYRHATRLARQARQISDGWSTDGPWGTALDEAYARNGWNLTPRQYRLLSLIYVNQYELTPAEDVERLSSWNLAGSTMAPGRPALVHGGLIQVVDSVASGLNILTGHTVTQIRHDNLGVSIETDQGSFSADYAVVTVPLGILKAGTIAFSPALPEWKQEAIDRLGFGTYSKTNLLFDKRYWPEHHVFYQAAQEKGDYPFWVNIDEHLGAPILSIHQVGDKARQNDVRTEEEATQRAMVAVRTLFGDGIPDPIGSDRTSWSTDHFALGSYSFNGIDSTPEHRVALGAPVGERLYFAGEATHDQYFATAHGALISGEKAAFDIIKAVG